MQTYAHIRHIEGTQFQVTGGSTSSQGTYSCFMQGASQDKKLTGIRPMESVLAALATCSSIDVVSILKKSKQVFKTFEVKITATRREQIPSIFTEINLVFIFSTESSSSADNSLDPRKVERAIDLSVNKYCSVAAMLKAGGVNINHSLQINS